jgi:hypothetical protein
MYATPPPPRTLAASGGPAKHPWSNTAGLTHRLFAADQGVLLCLHLALLLLELLPAHPRGLRAG